MVATGLIKIFFYCSYFIIEVVELLDNGKVPTV